MTIETQYLYHYPSEETLFVRVFCPVLDSTKKYCLSPNNASEAGVDCFRIDNIFDHAPSFFPEQLKIEDMKLCLAVRAMMASSGLYQIAAKRCQGAIDGRLNTKSFLNKEFEHAVSSPGIKSTVQFTLTDFSWDTQNYMAFLDASESKTILFLSFSKDVEAIKGIFQQKKIGDSLYIYPEL